VGFAPVTIRAVLFDIDGVLMDSREANVAWYRDFLAGHGYTDLPREDLERGHYYSLREAIAFLTKAPEQEVLAILDVARDLGGYPYHLVKLPEACEKVLDALRKTYSIGLVSSRIREGIDQFFDFSGLRDRFEVVVGYEDSEGHKPHPDPLLVACSRLGVEPHQAVYIGDAPTDFACAAAAGAHFIAFGDAIPEAQHQTNSFRALESILSTLDL
jgi:phosphoglycolate phosphatase-like HAD superfamily hydrolase